MIVGEGGEVPFEPERRSLRVLISAYACQPGSGSEAGRAWNIARRLAEDHDVWVATRANNRPDIESCPDSQGLHFIYHDLPRWARFWKRGHRGVEPYYYLWQATLYPVVRQIHTQSPFDLIHHVAFGRYWSPSFLSLLPAPFVWGPLGGGDSPPRSFRSGLSRRAVLLEMAREVARSIGERDPFVRLTLRRSSAVLARTPETANRLRRLGKTYPMLLPLTALSQHELEILNPTSVPNGRFRLASVGNLLHWKGFHLGIRALAAAELSGAEYWIIGQGPEKDRLRSLAMSLGVSDRVKFLGHLPRDQVLRSLRECHVLVHASLHDSFGWVCMEAMGAGLPVICLDIGGPAAQVTAETGFKIPARDPDQAVRGIAAALRTLASDRELRDRMGVAARQRADEEFNWEKQLRRLKEIYRHATGG